MNGNMKWILPLLVTIGMAANGMTVNWVNGKFQDHANRPHIGTATHEEYLILRQDLKDMQKKIDTLTTQVVRLQVILMEGAPK